VPDRIPIALIGCGGMGRRHLRGMTRLASSSAANIDLVAVCDLNQDNANFVADEARELLGHRPGVYADIAQMARDLGSDLQAASSLRTSPRTTRSPLPVWNPGCTCCAKNPWR
jgi:ornithine cyclodeaminase/alanine dehydrogenase-like protein (mu-crystallin family)